MAIISKINKNNNNYTMKGELSFCEAEYYEYHYQNEKYVRIRTFGSDERQNKGKASQVIHLNHSTAEKLVELLKDSFDL